MPRTSTISPIVFFLQTNANDRTDRYGGSVQDRVRFVLEVTDAVVKAVGAHRVGHTVQSMDHRPRCVCLLERSHAFF